MMPRRAGVFLLLASLPLAALSSRGADAPDRIKALGAENEPERATAVTELLKLGESARVPLMNAERDEKLKPQQLYLVRKLIGNLQVAQTPLKPLDLAKLTPFGEDKEHGIAGDPNLLVNRDARTITLAGEFVLKRGPLEYLVCGKGPNARLHETVVGVYPRPYDICFALLYCPYTFAGELGDDGRINLPEDAGAMISVQFDWETPNARMGLPAANPTLPPPVTGETRTVRVPIEFFAWNTQTENTMKRAPFAFTGSRWEPDPQTGKKVFVAEIEKSIVALKLDQYAILNNMLDTRDIDPQHDAGYSINRYLIPPRFTKCWVVFEPWSGHLTQADLTDTAPHGEAKGEAPAPPPPDEAPPPR